MDYRFNSEASKQDVDPLGNVVPFRAMKLRADDTTETVVEDRELEHVEGNALSEDGEAGPSDPTGPIRIVEVDDVARDSVPDDKVRNEVHGASLDQIGAPVQSEVTAHSMLVSAALSAIPDGYVLTSDGLYQTPADDSVEPIYISSPVHVEAQFADRSERGWGRLISVRSQRGEWHKIPVSNADLHKRPNDVLATLVDCGLELAPNKEAKKLIVDFLWLSKPPHLLQSVAQMGWTDEDHMGFVMGAELIGRNNILPVAGSANKGLKLSGSAEDWKNSVGALCRGNPMMILATSLAFSGPLLALVGQSSGGLHFRGASSSGKTTLLRLASSVWGSKEMISSWLATKNGLEGIARTLNDMLMPLDEIAEIHARDLHGAIYMLGNGAGKARMTKDAVPEEKRVWKLALISSGEISIQEKLKEGRLEVMAGQEVRLIDVEADSRAFGVFDDLHQMASGSLFSDTIARATSQFHGAVGKVFVERLVSRVADNKLDAIVGLIHKTATGWLEKLDGAADGQIARVANRFALIAIAGELATHSGLTGWATGEARSSAQSAFMDWYDRRFSAKREAVDAHVKPLQDFLAANLNSIPLIDPMATDNSNPYGWRDASRVYLTKEAWSEIFDGVAGTAAAKAMFDLRLMTPGEGGRITRKGPRGIPGVRGRFYTVNVGRLLAYKPDWQPE